MVDLFRSCAALLVVLFVETSTRADTSSPRFSLRWTRMPGATECVSETALAGAVEERLRRRVFEPPEAADVAIEGHVERSGDAWRATLSVTDSAGKIAGTRELSSADPNCHDLDAPLAITIALLIDPNAAASESPPPNGAPAAQPAEGRSTTAAAVPSTVRKATAEPSSVTRVEPWRSWVKVEGGVALGLLPTVSPGVVVGVGLVPPGIWPIVLGGALWTDEPAPSGGSSPVDFSLATGGVGTCPLQVSWHPIGLNACAGVELGVLSTRGLSDGTILVRRRFVIAAVARMEATLAMGSHWFLSLGGGPSVPLTRDFFDYDNGENTHLVFRMAPVGAVFSSGLGFRTP